MFERARFFKQVCRSGHDLQALFGLQVFERFAVHFDDCRVAPTHDEQGRGLDAR